MIELDKLKNLAVGDEVHWTDPDHNKSSGIYTMDAILTESGEIEDEDSIVYLINDSGSEAEVFAHELH